MLHSLQLISFYRAGEFSDILIETEMALTANHAVIGCAGYW